jgi:hypothetical protein
MSLPTSGITYEIANAEYDRTVQYRSDSTGQMAEDFIAVCIWLTGRRPSASSNSLQAGAKFETNYSNLETQIENAQKWLANLRTSAANEAAAIQARGGNLPRQFGLCDLRGGW